MLTHQDKPTYIVMRVPAWATKVYIILAAVLLPWTIYLGLSLPSRHLSAHWDVTWAGLDAGIVIALLATGLLAYLRSIWIVMAATSAGTLLLVDAWFDVLSEHSSVLFHQALMLAFVFELPLAIMSYYLAGHALHHNTKRHHHKFRF